MDMGLTGKVAAITSGSGAMGQATAQLFAREGVKVAISARREDALQEVASTIEAGGGECFAFPADLTEPGGPEQFIAATVETFGQVDVVANILGGAHDKIPFLDLTDEDWYRALDINLMVAVRLARAAIPHMQRQGGGSIINVSAAGIRHAINDPADDHVHYTAAKAAQAMLSKYLSRDHGKDNIRVNTILPSWIFGEQATRRYAQQAQELGISESEVFMRQAKQFSFAPDLPRPGTPDEIARAMLFFASDMSSYVTGTTLAVDGGSTDYL